jgi:hypothetical protein
MVTTGWLACSPGELDCAKVNCAPASTGGNGGSGGSGGSGGAGGGGMTDEVPEACKGMGVNSTGDFETKFIVPKCGKDSMCHQAVFPPRNLHMQSMIKSAMVNKNAATLCKTDKYIDPDNIEKSFVLAKITAEGDKVECPSGGEGGTRMPNSMAAVAGPRLSDEEIECFTWWVKQVIK